MLGLARHSETLETLVVYKASYQPEGENLWVRPLAMFREKVLHQGREVWRFERLDG